jgi:hypothetical protein
VMNIPPESNEWLHQSKDKQRNLVSPDTARNFGGFWGGLYRQKLNTVQTVGLAILIVFYVVLFAGLVAMTWPAGDDSFWHKIFYGYGPYVLLSLPLVIFFLVLRSRLCADNSKSAP